MWKFDASYSAEEKKTIIENLSSLLLGLEGIIEELKSIAVHTNTKGAPESNYDVLLDTSFENLDDLSTYAGHPEHLKVVEYLKGYNKERSCVDYEY
jgi:hypothetical protein